MIGYICKYTPVEVIESFGEKMVRMDPSVSGFDRAETVTHANMCTYSKAVLEDILKNSRDKELDGLILVTCCDSIKRLYDVLKDYSDFKFLHIIDVPRKNDNASAEIYKNEIIKLIKKYEEYSNKKFSKESFLERFRNNEETVRHGDINIAVMGARCQKSILDMIEDSGGNVEFNFTCTSYNGIDSSEVTENKNMDIDNLLKLYARELLNTYPCMRMADTGNRISKVKSNKNNIDGIIYNTIKFCDMYSYEYSTLKNKLNIPILKIETDYTAQSSGQIRTRIEAFMESIKQSNRGLQESAASMIKTNYKLSGNRLITVGIDSGSTSTNAVIIDENKNILASSVIRTGAKSIDSANKAFGEVLEKAHLTRNGINKIVSTGYGRVSIPFADMDITEITCHGKGAYFINNNIRTIIDIGGQDSKVIRLNENGEVTDFVMNDKCAAGTGRFLEMMARTLEIPIEEMGQTSLKWKEDITITNMCTVFAESEVISLIAQNKEIADIIHGLNNSISGKILSLLGRLGKKGSYMMTGGVARNIGVIKAIEEKLGEKVYVYEEPEIVGALGAAILGLESILK